MLEKQYSIKIPNSTKIFYYERKNALIIEGPLKKNYIKLKVKLKLTTKSKTIDILSVNSNNKAYITKKTLKSLKGTTAALIKQAITESSVNIFQKLVFVGVGYRGFDTENYENRILSFKLGFSHPLYFRIFSPINIFSLKFTKFFVYGNSYQGVNQTAANIRKNKLPEPYKGKGIRYENEKIILKEGKKV